MAEENRVKLLSVAFNYERMAHDMEAVAQTRTVRNKQYASEEKSC